MRKVILSLFLAMGLFVHAQSVDYNTKKGFVAKGHDVVAYFDGTATEGHDDFSTAYDGVNYKFSNQENLNKFISDPKKYIPQYGGYCAYAMGVSGKKVNIDPETFEIREGKLYLFYNAGKTNTLELWLEESPNELKVQADKNWEKTKTK